MRVTLLELAASAVAVSVERYVAPATECGRRVRSTLVVGDGDLSCSEALVAASSGAREVLATTLDSRRELDIRYGAPSVERAERLGARHGIDARALDAAFPGASFDRVVWNFPHVDGKMNIGKNRELLRRFFVSVSTVLADDGEVLVALAAGQGGTEVERPENYDATWQLDAQGAYGGLLVASVAPLEPFYTVVGGRSDSWRRTAFLHVLSRRVTAVSAPAFAVELLLVARAQPDQAAVSLAARRALGDEAHFLVDIGVSQPPYGPLRDGRFSFGYRLVFASRTAPLTRDQADGLWHRVLADIRDHLPANDDGDVAADIRRAKTASRVSRPLSSAGVLPAPLRRCAG